MAIVLTKDEKRTFYGFLGLYLGSSFLLIAIIASLFYSYQKSSLTELTLSKMEISAGDISHQIIQAHMQGFSLDLTNFKLQKNLQYNLYDNHKEPVFKQFDTKIDFEKKTFTKKDKLFYVYSGVAGHKGVSFIVLQESDLQNKIKKLKDDIIYSTIVIFLVITLIGFYLSKLFIHPIQIQREKLNTFIKDTTHELNTPLSALLLCIDAKDFHTQENKERMKLSAKKLSNLYKDLKYLILNDKEREEPFLYDLSVLLQDELPYYKQLAARKKIDIQVQTEKTIFLIDKESFYMLVNNLVYNAIKYTQRNGKISIILSAGTLSIQDNGIGIEKEKLNKIFERYYRATEAVGGFGIGLNIVYSICKRYKIKINVSSEFKKGTTFSLSF